MTLLRLQQMWLLCRECAGAVYSGRHTPDPMHVNNVARLLFGTGAVESEYIYARQRAYSIESEGGAFGFWQVEACSVKDSIGYIKRNSGDWHRIQSFIPTPIGAKCRDMVCVGDVAGICRLMVYSPFVAVAFARLHYARDPKPIPETVESQAMYYKRVFNTVAGAGSAEGYMDAWVQHCAGVVA